MNKNKQKFYTNCVSSKDRLYIESGHTWEEDEDGFINIMASAEGIHNGPKCTKCGYEPCWHCEPIPQKCNK